MVTLPDIFGLTSRVAVVTGASGAIGSALTRGLGGAGAHVALLARRAEPLESLAKQLAEAGVDAHAWTADVRNGEQLAKVRDAIVARWGSIDILVNLAGGNIEKATLDPVASPFDLDTEAIHKVIDLNLVGTVTATSVFGQAFNTSAVDDKAILNVSSISAARALSRVGAYGAAKAGIESLTRSLALELGHRATGIRVNAIAPGFFIGNQNRFLLVRPDGEPTERGRAILARTPLGRFGAADDLVSTAIWLCSPGARFVTGAVVPVDGGFSASAGV